MSGSELNVFVSGISAGKSPSLLIALPADQQTLTKQTVVAELTAKDRNVWICVCVCERACVKHKNSLSVLKPCLFMVLIWDVVVLSADIRMVPHRLQGIVPGPDTH